MITRGQLIARKFFSANNAESYDTVVKYATFGKDSVWKRHIVDTIGNNHKRRILDLACGTGILSTFISSNKDIKLIGGDLTFDYILKAKERKRYSLLVNCVAEFLPFSSNHFDVVISSYLVKYTDSVLLVKELWRILDSDGLVIFHDFTYPKKRVIRIIWNWYFRILNQIGKVFKTWEYVFSDLDKVIKDSIWETNLVRELEKTGFRSINSNYYTLGTASIITAIKP